MQPNNKLHSQFRLLCGGLALAALILHFYTFCYAAFAQWDLTTPIIDRLATNLGHSGPFHYKASSKLIALFFLGLTAVGSPADYRIPSLIKLLLHALLGLCLYFGSDILLQLTARPTTLAAFYMAITLAGLALLYSIIRQIVSLVAGHLSNDIFNTMGQTFPQQEQKLPGPQSIHLRARYQLGSQTRASFINLEIYRGTLVMGTPGSGKTRYVFRQMIRQSLANKMALFVYDLKYDDLTRLTYNSFRSLGPDPGFSPAFYSVNFDDLACSHRCNPLDPSSLDDISDAAEAARTMLLSLNRKWVDMQGDFFCESAISFFTATIWFLRRYEDGRYCTLPHLIELIQTEYHELFSILQSYPEIQTRINSFIVAYQSNTMEQLQGQVDSARVPLAALASPRLYYLLSANDFTLDINDPAHPKIVCIGSNPQKQHIYGAIVSLYVSRMLKLINRKGGTPCHLLYDEFTSFYAPNMPQTIATGRANKIAITLGIQDLSQLRAEYGRNQADALFNLPGNIISGQVSGDSASQLSARFGKILQERSTISINSRDTSTSQSHQLDPAIPPSKIATLSSGEFVGITADNPSQPMRLKAFHCRIDIDYAALQKEEQSWVSLPQVAPATPQDIDRNFRRIKEEVRQLVQDRLALMQDDPELARLLLTRNRPSYGPKRSPS